MWTRGLWAAVAVGLMSSNGMAGNPSSHSKDERQEEPRQASAVLDEAQISGVRQAVEAAEIEAEEAAESAVSSPPMEMDDPGTPGPNGIEVNLVGILEHSGPGRGSETLLDANFGIGDRIQLKLERPYVKVGVAGQPTQAGLGATQLGVKWRFLDGGTLEMAVYPDYALNDGLVLKDEEGSLGEDEGSSVYLPLLISTRVKRVYTVGANFGYRKNLDYSANDDIVAALGVGRSLGESSRILIEVYSERDEHAHNRQTDVRMGTVFRLVPKWLARSRFEFPGFASLGRSIGRTEAGEPGTSFAFGVSVVVKPKR